MSEPIYLDTLPPEEQQSIQTQAADASQNQPDVVDQLSAKDLSEIPDFDPIEYAKNNPDRATDPKYSSKLADAHAFQIAKGVKLTDIAGPDANEGAFGVAKGLTKKIAGGVKDIAVGAAKYAGRALELPIEANEIIGGVSSADSTATKTAKRLFNATAPGLIYNFVNPQTPKTESDKEFEKIAQARGAELVASTELAGKGLVDMGARALRKGGRLLGILPNPLDQTPQQRDEEFFSALGNAVQNEKVAGATGALTETLTRDVVPELESQGYKIDRKNIADMSAGDPLSFVAFGQGFKVIGALGKTLGTAASRGEAVALLTTLRQAQRASIRAASAESGAVAGLNELKGSLTGPTAAPAITEAGQAATKASMAAGAAASAEEAAQGAVNKSVAARALATTPEFSDVSAAGNIKPLNPLVESAANAGLQVQAKAGQVAQAVRGEIRDALNHTGVRVATNIAKNPAAAVLGAGSVAAGAGLKGAGWAGRLATSFLPPLATPRAARVLTEGTMTAGERALNAGKKILLSETKDFTPRMRFLTDTAKVGADVAQGAAKGFIKLDVPLAAATSETPKDMQNAPVFGAAFGGIGGLARGAAGLVQGQLIPGRRWTSEAPITNLGKFSSLDAATKNSVDTATDAQQPKWFSAMRQFLQPTGAQLYWISDPVTFSEQLRKVAPTASDEWINEASQQRAVALKARGDDGQVHNIILAHDANAAPHETVHSFQDAIGEAGMQKIDDLVYREYAPVWEVLGQRYATQFGKNLAEYAQRGEGWQEAVNDIQFGSQDWRKQLSPEQADSAANLYLNREISAELGDTVIRGNGIELAKAPGLVGSIARILGHTLVGLGIEPFEGASTEGQQIPVRMGTVEKFRDEFKNRIEGLTVEAKRNKVREAKPYNAPRVTPAGAPATETAPEEPVLRTPSEAASDAREIASSAPTASRPGGLRSISEITTDVANAIDNQTGLTVNYLSAPGEPAGAIVSTRAGRRAVIEAFRNMPEASRKLWEKNFFPERVTQTGSGKIQFIGWTPEVFAANAFRLTEALSEKGATGLVPYPIDPATKSFTEHGWQQLFEDVTTFVKNQKTGSTGSGLPLVTPKEITDRGFFTPEGNNEAPQSLSQDRADIISALFGIKLPTTPRIGKVFPRNLAGQAVSEATLPGRVTPPVEPLQPFTGEKAQAHGIEGETIKEVNPFRQTLAEKGIKPEFIEAIQRLNADRVADVSENPISPEFRANEFILQAGFQPKERNPRAIRAAAVKTYNGDVFEGGIHALALWEAMRKHPTADEFNSVEGFTTHGGEFLNREDAYKRAVELDQMAPEAGVREGIAYDKTGKTGALESVSFKDNAKFQPKNVGAEARLRDIRDKHEGMRDAWSSIFTESMRRLGWGSPKAEDFRRTAAEVAKEYGFDLEEAPGGGLQISGYSESERALANAEEKFRQMNKSQFQPKETDQADYDKLVSQMKGLSLEDKFGAPGQKIRDQIEEIKNRNGGALPGQPEGLGSKFQPKTAAGVKLEKNGFEIKRAGFPGYRALQVTKDGQVIGEILSSRSHEDPKEIVIGGVDVKPSYRRQGVSEAMYRELLTDLRDDGATKVTGYVIHPGPIRTRAKLLPNTEFSSAGKTLSIGEALKGTPDIAKALGLPADAALRATSELSADMKFQPKPNEDVQKVADDYSKEIGLDRQKHSTLELKPATAMKIADFYENAKSDPANKEVAASYDALAKETKAQYEAIVDAGYDLEPYTGKGEPYKSSDEMTADVRDNKHLYFLPTASALASSDKANPMLQPSGVKDWPVNDLFRAVHDFFGHAAEGLQFGPKGELNAWKVHSEMYSPEAQGALAAETLAQNSWVNFGPHLRNAEGNVPAKGEVGYVSPPERPFAEQKNIVVPADLISEARGAQFQPKESKWRKEAVALYEKDPEHVNEYLGGRKALMAAARELDRRGNDFKAADLFDLPTDYADAADYLFHEVADKKAPKTAAAEEAPDTWTPPKKGNPLLFGKAGSDSTTKAWVLPDGTFKALGGQWHDANLIENKADYAKRFDITSGSRTAALSKNFTRLNLNTANGLLSIETRQSNWTPELKNILRRIVETNADGIDKITVHLFDPKITHETRGASEAVFNLPNSEKSDNIPLMKVTKQAITPSRPEGQGPSAIERARNFPIGGEAAFQPEKSEKNTYYWADLTPGFLEVARKAGYRTLDLTSGGSFHNPTVSPVLRKDELGRWSLSPEDVKNAKDAAETSEINLWEMSRDAQFQPKRWQPEEMGLPGMEHPKEVLSTRALSEMNQKDRRAYYPEAVVPKSAGDKIPSEITNSPLYKQAGSEEAAVKAFSDRLVQFAKENQDLPEYAAGAKWYSEFTPLLKKHFGKDAEVMSELLAATSPNTNPQVNFGYAFDALKSAKAGRFDGILEKFKEGLEKEADGSLEKWYNNEVKKGRVENPPADPSPATYLAQWIHSNDLKPRQSNGALYWMHGSRVLAVLARVWLERNKGPKTRQFVENLQGKSDGATIDVWADRTMRWAGYEGLKDRWRILPESAEGVSDEDFAFSQKAFADAAERLGMKPSALQGALWFAEKKRWADNGWGRLDLGDFRSELNRIPVLEKRFQSNIKPSEGTQLTLEVKAKK